MPAIFFIPPLFPVLIKIVTGIICGPFGKLW